jgi:hypothetical protein
MKDEQCPDFSKVSDGTFVEFRVEYFIVVAFLLLDASFRLDKQDARILLIFSLLLH